MKLFLFSPVCTAVETIYYCTCEDQYVWPYNICIDECNSLSEDLRTCNCIRDFPSGGAMCVPESGMRNILAHMDTCTRLKCLFLYSHLIIIFFIELTFFEFSIEIEMNTTSTAVIHDVMYRLETFSFPLNNIFEITKMDITTGKN